MIAKARRAVRSPGLDVEFLVAPAQDIPLERKHGLAPDATVRKWQNRITPLWKRFTGGCHLNRDIPALIAQGGFRIQDMETMYLRGWRPATFNYWGTAEPRRASPGGT